ncbi:hypothetical protein FBU59_002742 [Linderina macrospora]|uniref:Uncharacterized protein n=1 Tax=Linderina macrospora TaxID=4868 RepID=A0ACC1JAG9_9FUNG|nr:hypothetical protein FBU59_002742 [Linderina macrospora]
MNSKKTGGRIRPAPLVLMYAPAIANDSPAAEGRSLSLLTVDTQNEYVDVDLHRQRVRCVLDGVESRGLVYRARRMQSRLDHHLATNRERYIRVYRSRMNRLLETGLFHASDMQTIRAYLYRLETHGDDNGGVASSEAPVSSGRTVFENGQLRERVVVGDVEDALIRLKSRFKLPLEIVESGEFRAFCRAMFQCQRDGGLAAPFYTTAEAYARRAGVVAARRRAGVCARLARSQRYSVLLEKADQRIGVSVAIERQRLFVGWVDDANDDGDATAQRIVTLLAELEHGVAEADPEARPVLVSVVGAQSEIRQAVARAVPCAYQIPSAPQFIDSLASVLLDPGGQFAVHVTSLVEVAKAIIHSHDAHKRWVERKQQPITLPDPAMATSHLHMFQQLVSVDYEFLLQLKTIVSPSCSGYFDNLLDRTLAPMFLALVQIFAVLDQAASVASTKDMSMADLAVLLARLEKSLQVLAAGTHPSSTDDMQMLAKHVILVFRSQLEAEYADALPTMILAHSLSFYPQESVRTTFAPPLALQSILDHARELWTRVTAATELEPHFTMPELYARHAAFCEALETARARYSDDLPSFFSMAKILALAGLAPNHEWDPFETLSAALCDAPVAAVAGLSDRGGGADEEASVQFADQCARDEMEIAISEDLERRNDDAVSTSSPKSVAQHCRELLMATFDYNEATPADAHSDQVAGFGASSDVIAAWQEPNDSPVHSLLLCYFDAAQLAPLVHDEAGSMLY